MQYQGKYSFFDANAIRTYPLRTRRNRVALGNLTRPANVADLNPNLPPALRAEIETIAELVVSARHAGRPVMVFTGAHLIKNGFGPLLADLVHQGLVTLVAGNAATAIHDFELALIGETSEDVPQALAEGQFGMAYEFAYVNCALSVGDRLRLGFGESLGRMICDDAFRNQVLAVAAAGDSPRCFTHPEVSVLAACYDRDIPCTIHTGIGTDVIDQHPSFDGQAKGGCSGRDFLIYAQEATRLAGGGVVLNIGSAVTGPEVLLKAVSMAANIGFPPQGIVTADFDLRQYLPGQVSDESAQGYYYRDQKSVATRIPQAFGGRGFYIEGDQKKTFPFLYGSIISRCHFEDAQS